MAEHLLDGAKVGAFLQQVSAEGMAQSVRVYVWREAFGDGDLLNDASDAASGEAAAPLIDEQRRRISWALAANFQAGGNIGRQGNLNGVAERNVTFFFPFAANENGFRAQADVVEIDADEFGVTDAASVKEFEHEPVALGE